MSYGQFRQQEKKENTNKKYNAQVRRAEPNNTYKQSPLITHYRHIGNQAVQRLVAGEGLKPAQQEQPKPVNNGIPEPVREKMESAFDADFSDVKVHPNSSKAPDLGALAYTQGNHIHFAPGMYNPHSTSGRQILGHELAHVVQQREGRVKPTMQMSGLPVNDNHSLEGEADRMGAAAFSGLSPIPSIPLTQSKHRDVRVLTHTPLQMVGMNATTGFLYSEIDGTTLSPGTRVVAVVSETPGYHASMVFEWIDNKNDITQTLVDLWGVPGREGYPGHTWSEAQSHLHVRIVTMPPDTHGLRFGPTGPLRSIGRVISRHINQPQYNVLKDKIQQLAAEIHQSKLDVNIDTRKTNPYRDRIWNCSLFVCEVCKVIGWYLPARDEQGGLVDWGIEDPNVLTTGGVIGRGHIGSAGFTLTMPHCAYTDSNTAGTPRANYGYCLPLRAEEPEQTV